MEDVIKAIDYVRANLHLASELELRALNADLVEHLRSLRNRKNFKEASKYRVGDRVEFEGKHGKVLRGVVRRINMKTLTIDEEGRPMRWRVPYCYCKPLEEAP